MNSERKERREVQLAKKAETIEAAASEVLVINETRIKIDGRPYELGERFSQILTKYDYIVGDWGYDQLRLRGFYEIGSKKGSPYQSIERLDDYLYEYCNFGCSYFILHNLEVQTPEPIPANIRKKSSKRKSQSSSKKHNSKNNVFTNEKRYNIRSQKNKKNAHLKSVSKKNTKHRHFTIRQK